MVGQSLYSYVGDMSLAFLIMVFFVALKSSFDSKDFGLKYIKSSFLLIFISCICNMGFYFIEQINFGVIDISLSENLIVILMYILHYISRVLVLVVVCLYMEYILHFLSNNQYTLKVTTVVRHVYRTLFLISSFFICTSFLTGLGLYYDKDLHTAIFNSKADSFIITMYVFFALVLFLLFTFTRDIINQVRRVLMVATFMNLILFNISVIFKNMSYTNLIVIIPFVIVLFMLHASPFNYVTGNLTYNNFEYFLADKIKKGSKVTYLVIHFLDDFNGLTFKQEDGKFFYNFWKEYFEKCYVFELATTTFVLTVEDELVTKETLESLIKDNIILFADKIGFDFKIYGLVNIDFLQSISEFINIDNYFEKRVKLNSYELYSTKEELAKAKDFTIIVQQLNDINEKVELIKEDINNIDIIDIEDERVLVYCQPVKNVHTNKFDTAEILMRMELPDLGFINPDVFIPIAEQFNYIHALTLIIFSKTCSSLKNILGKGYEIQRVSVNVSVKEFKNPEFSNEIVRIIKKHGIPYDKIAIELTESKNDDDYSKILSQILVLKEYGIKFYLDDFGTGYSNFDRILGLNLDVVKFDKSLLNLSESNENTKFVLKYFSNAFEKLDYHILFEGVETDEQADLCVNSNADYLQGFKYSKPIPLENLTEFLDNNNERTTA